ncbi:MAG TPA: tetratricopeptide repeat protein [Chitinophagales bacterium]|nr:tetratricopeptide repeat protein [Chitinophagales bacterium]
MKQFQKVSVFLFLLLCSSALRAQTAEEALIKEGVQLNHSGEFQKAIEKFQEALDINSKSSEALYGIGNAYYKMGKYEKAIEFSEKAIRQDPKNSEPSYILMGSAYDALSKSPDAIKVYKQGIKKFPRSSLLHYNLAVTYFQAHQDEDAEKEAIEDLKINPSHSSAHMILAYIMMDKSHRVQSVMALCHFLFLEPEGDRSVKALDMLYEQLKRGVEKESETQINISMSAGDANDPFRGAEVMISMLEASKNLEVNEDKSEEQLFYENSKSLFSVLSRLKKDNKGFWWDYYVDFFSDLNESENTEAFCYYIQQSSGDEDVLKWLSAHKDQVDKLLSWYSSHTPGF